MKKILLFAGSNNPSSINRALLGAVAAELDPDAYTLIDLRDFPLPLYSIELQGQGIPPQAIALRKVIDPHPLLIISVAEHNGSISAFFKNTLDWLSRVESQYKAFQHKQVFLLSASPGKGGTGALDHAEAVLSRLGATVAGKVPVSDFYQRTYFTGSGLGFRDTVLHKTIHDITSKLVL